MATLGLVGGIGPESTIEYYRTLLAAYRARHGAGEAPSVVINSIDVRKLLGLFGANDLAAATTYLADEVRRLADAGATVGLFAANTPHLVFDDVQQRSPIPLVSIVTATCEDAKRRGLKRLALFGTRFTMDAPFYPDAFTKAGMTIVGPADDERAYIHEKYTTELLRNLFLPATRDELLRIVDAMKERDGIDGVILGGTELPLILRGETVNGVPLLDTTEIHARAAVDRAWP